MLFRLFLKYKQRASLSFGRTSEKKPKKNLINALEPLQIEQFHWGKLFRFIMLTEANTGYREKGQNIHFLKFSETLVCIITT